MWKTQLCSQLVTMALAMVAIAGEGETQILRMEEVPSFIVDIANSKIAGVDWIMAIRDKEGSFRLLGNMGKSGRAEFICNAAGADHLMFLPVPMSNVPEKVRASVLREMPDFVVQHAHVCSLDGVKVYSYRFQGKGYDGGSTGFFGVFVDFEGKKVKPLK